MFIIFAGTNVHIMPFRNLIQTDAIYIGNKMRKLRHIVTYVALLLTFFGAKAQEEETEVTDRFCMLSAIDAKKDSYGSPKYDKGITLKDFCETFRNYAKDGYSFQRMA